MGKKNINFAITQIDQSLEDSSRKNNVKIPISVNVLILVARSEKSIDGYRKRLIGRQKY